MQLLSDIFISRQFFGCPKRFNYNIACSSLVFCLHLLVGIKSISLFGFYTCVFPVSEKIVCPRYIWCLTRLPRGSEDLHCTTDVGHHKHFYMSGKGCWIYSSLYFTRLQTSSKEQKTSMLLTSRPLLHRLSMSGQLTDYQRLPANELNHITGD